MKTTITGNEPLSKRILLDIDNGIKVSAIPDIYPVSLDQAKRLSRFKKMLDLAKENLEEEHYNRLQMLGIKGLPLSHLFRQSDWGGLTEILSVVTDDTKRDELHLLIEALNEKRQRIQDLKEKADLTLSHLEDAHKSLHKKEKELLQLQEEMNEQIKIFNKYPEPFRTFLNEYLGLYTGRLVLTKRLNVNWQRSLQKQEIIVYNETLHVYFIKDFNAFVESLKSRHERGFEYRWDPDKDITRVNKQTPWADMLHNEKYKLPSAFNDQFIHSIDKIKKELNEVKEQKLAIAKKLKSMKNQTVQSYMEMTEVSTHLSTDELKKHKELQDKALKWLFQRGFVAVSEFDLPNGRRADIFAYNEAQIIIFEIKVSYRDLTMDLKWSKYLPYCHEFYFLTPSDLVPLVKKEINEVNCGQYVETGNSIKLIKPDEREVKKVEQESELKFSAAQLLSKKYIYRF